MALICSSELTVSFILILFSSLPFIDIVIESLFIYFLVCQEVPEEPVLSTVSNHVFERRLILKYLQENGTDPINGEPLEETQLLEIKCKLWMPLHVAVVGTEVGGAYYDKRKNLVIFSLPLCGSNNLNADDQN